MTRSPQSGTVNRSWTALSAALVLVVGFSYSDDIVEFALDMTAVPYAGPGPWLVAALDCIVAATAAVLAWRMTGRLFTGRWWLGTALVVLTHAVLLSTAGVRAGLDDTARFWVGLAASAVFVAAMALLLDNVLGDGPASRSWLAPLVIGTFAAQFASALWYPVIDVAHGCAGEVSRDYFGNAIQIIPVLLLALAVELNFLRGDQGPGARAASVLTVTMLCAGEALAFSVVVKGGLGQPCGLAAVWHEYIAFVVTAQALGTGLAAMAWLLISRPATAD